MLVLDNFPKMCFLLFYVNRSTLDGLAAYSASTYLYRPNKNILSNDLKLLIKVRLGLLLIFLAGCLVARGFRELLTDFIR